MRRGARDDGEKGSCGASDIRAADVPHPALSRETCTLTRAKSAASPATERARRVASRAERGTLTWERKLGRAEAES